MKELNEYKAEIFRRSEERIKQKKRIRKRVLLCALPCLLCAGVLSAVVLPNIGEAGWNRSPGKSENDGAIGGLTDIADGTELDFTSAEIVRDDGDITEVSVVVKKDGLYTIYNALNEALAQGQEDGKHFADNNGGSDSSHSFAYTITFTSETSGRTEVYTLKGRFLSDETTKERVFLSEEDYNRITALLD